jgi:hypothetical protein
MDQVVSEQPTVRSYQAELAQALGNLADALAALGRFDAAKADFERARTIYRKLLHGDPQDVTIKDCLAWLEREINELENDPRRSPLQLADRPRAAEDTACGHAAPKER